MGILKVAFLALGLLLAANAQAGPILVEVFRGHTLVGGGAPYSGKVGEFFDTDIRFASETLYNWHPFGLPDFGALITGHLAVDATDTYTFRLDSDDGSLLFIDNLLVVDNGGPQPPDFEVGSALLTAGIHEFRVEFFECCGGPSGVDLILPEGVVFNGPESGTLLLVGLGTLSLLGYGRRRRA